MKRAIYRNPFVFSPPPRPSVGCAPSEMQTNHPSTVTQHQSSVTDQVAANGQQPIQLGTNQTLRQVKQV